MDVDSMVLHFDESQLRLLNYCLGFMMFGVALDLSISDFRRVFLNPRSTLIGMTSQLILLPLFTFLLVLIWDMPNSMKMGLLLIAACPGGNVSNYLVHRAGGNTALSITLTSIATLLSVFLTPFMFFIYSRYFFKLQHEVALDVDMDSMIGILLQLIMIPLAAGMILHHFAPQFTARIRKFIKPLSVFLLIIIIIVALSQNIANAKEYLPLVFSLVLIHNGGSYLIGYFFAKALKEPEENARAVAFETGIQNSGLGLVLIFNFFNGLGGMALVAGWWGVWDLVSGFFLSEYWSRGIIGRLVKSTNRTRKA